jgi:hypothetical protein
LDSRRLSSTALLKEYLIKGRRHCRKFRLGDAVRVVRINVFRSEIDFELV